jgi:hypothetical protein
MASSSSDRRLTVTVAIIAAIATCLAAVLTKAWPESCNRPRPPSPAEEAATLHQLTEVLELSQAANVKYADFTARVDRNTTFGEYFQTWADMGSTKEQLLKRLPRPQPASRFSRLCEILAQSLQSDDKLMALEKDSLQHTLDALKVMQTVPPPSNDPKLSEAEKRQKALEVLVQFRDKIHKWREQSAKLQASMKSSLANSSTAVQLLNEELARLGLPYRHENPFLNEANTLASPAAAK